MKNSTSLLRDSGGHRDGGSTRILADQASALAVDSENSYCNARNGHRA